MFHNHHHFYADSNNGTASEEVNNSSHVFISANALFVVMSYFISVLGSFTAFQMIHETRYAVSRIKRLIFVICASISMSLCAIWSMHFVGTVCFSHRNNGQRLNITYNVALTVTSAIVPFVACFFGFICTTIQLFVPKFRMLAWFPFSLCWPENPLRKSEASSSHDSTIIENIEERMRRKKEGRLRRLKRFMIASVIGDEFRPHIAQILIGALFAAAGICTMHYIGMLATQIEGTVRVWHPGVIVASVIIAYLASCAALWIAFAVRNEYQQILSSLVAGVAVSGMHYTGMASVTYHHVAVKKGKPGVSMSNYDMTMVVSMLTSATCFLMLIIASFSSRKRSGDLRKSMMQIEQEKRKVQSSVDQLNDMFSRMASEEHLTRRILNLISDGVCVINRRGQIMKANQVFDRICAITDSDSRGEVQQYLVGVMDVEREFFKGEQDQSQVTIRHPFSQSEKKLQIRSTVANDDGQYCILVFEENSEKDSSNQQLFSFVEADYNRVSLLDQSLMDPEFLSRFKSFCELEMCGENLEFLDMTQKYKKCANVLDRIEIQREILSNFVEPGSKKQLNLPLNILSQSSSQIEQAYGQLDLFDSLEKQVKVILSDSYFRFTKL